MFKQLNDYPELTWIFYNDKEEDSLMRLGQVDEFKDAYSPEIIVSDLTGCKIQGHECMAVTAAWDVWKFWDRTTYDIKNMFPDKLSPSDLVQ